MRKLALVLLFAFITVAAVAQFKEPPQVQPADLAKTLSAAKGEKPLILYVGPKMLYVQAHITGAEYVGPASNPDGVEALKAKVKSVPKTRAIVLYCGYCPWSHCPNIHPAYSTLQGLGFTNVKVLYIANNFGADWYEKGYPTSK